jgi:uncharacterized protein with ParB-like and HNH nuclease domain
MQVQQLPIYQFLEGSGKSFIIPVYQRDYAWTRINCQKLWDDLVDLKENKSFEAFRKSKIVLIDLIRGQDDPQLIFESLNATGVKLKS